MIGETGNKESTLVWYKGYTEYAFVEKTCENCLFGEEKKRVGNVMFHFCTWRPTDYLKKKMKELRDKINEAEYK